MRGEYDCAHFGFSSLKELPPRARRIHDEVENCALLIGTTSACAENTRHVTSSTPYFWNYLRVRGEYQIGGAALGSDAELPPRARRIHRAAVMGGVPAGTTSACAENTRGSLEQCPPTWNYLRVRGEY